MEKQFPTFRDTSADLEFQETNSDEFKQKFGGRCSSMRDLEVAKTTLPISIYMGSPRTEMGRETWIFPHGESPFPNRVCFHLGTNIHTRCFDLPARKSSVLPATLISKLSRYEIRPNAPFSARTEQLKKLGNVSILPRPFAPL